MTLGLMPLWPGEETYSRTKKTIKSVSNSDTEILSPDLSHALRDKSLIEIETYDISLLKLLSKGLILDEIALDFKSLGIVPNGSSSIEKRINKLKIYFKANNNVHLIAMAKDLGVL